ncbi:GUN4 domain protein [Leptolyngbya sp. NIES-3755]|nr:GUN4 domain protein [Leptolyngbya sp. NIES-3755]
MKQQPNNTDAILGDQSLLNSLVLGGIEGLRQRVKLATPEQKIDLLTDTLNYDATGIDLLIDLLNDAELKVRITAYELLTLIDSEKARTAIAQGIRLNPGDLIYHVYESLIAYNCCWNYLQVVTEFEGWLVEEHEPPKWISTHFVREQAEAEAAKLHRKQAYSLYLGNFLRRKFVTHFEEWVIDHGIFDRQPQESAWEFAERLRQLFEATGHSELIVQLWQNLQKQDFDVDQWFASLSFSGRLFEESDSDFGIRLSEILKALQYDEQFGELWVEAAGRLAFVHEEVVAEVKHVNSIDFEI